MRTADWLGCSSNTRPGVEVLRVALRVCARATRSAVRRSTASVPRFTAGKLAQSGYPRKDFEPRRAIMGNVLTRRELLSHSTVLLLLVPAIAGCASSSGGSSGSSSCDGISETSTVTNSHTHTLCVLTSDLTSPPAAGVTYTTSTSSGHNHTVALTQAQLQSIESGGSV